MAEQTPIASVLFVTLGCAKNEVDTDRMRALLLKAGFSEAADPEEADVAIVNTCSFLASATEESVEATLELAEGRAEGVRECPIVMCGCVPSRYGDELPEQLPEVAAFVRSEDEDGIVGVVADVLGVQADLAPVDFSGTLRTIDGASSFVKIVLIGQDTGIWGSDFEGDQTLAKLLRQVAEVVRPYDGWVRVLYLQPEGMTDELIATIRDVDEVLPYIDIPIQHCSERVLASMGRSGSSEQLRELFARLRREIPGMVLRTTGMCGFPGEPDEEADELYDFIQEEEFDYTSVFAYSQEDGTKAARMEDQVDEDVKLERTQRLMDLVEQLGFSATAKHVGERVRVIIDGAEEGEDGPELIGHAWFQAPDCDGAVHIAAGEVSVGDIVTVDLVDSFCYELVGEIVEEGEAE